MVAYLDVGCLNEFEGYSLLIDADLAHRHRNQYLPGNGEDLFRFLKDSSRKSPFWILDGR